MNRAAVLLIPPRPFRAWRAEEAQRLQGCQEEGQGEEGGRSQVPLWRDQQQEEEGLLGERGRVRERVYV